MDTTDIPTFRTDDLNSFFETINFRDFDQGRLLEIIEHLDDSDDLTLLDKFLKAEFNRGHILYQSVIDKFHRAIWRRVNSPEEISKRDKLRNAALDSLKQLFPTTPADQEHTQLTINEEIHNDDTGNTRIRRQQSDS